ncbi:unnamed protein product [Ectocarpus sp. CCAP 1310/34]|nr:unnamed protein product [Ectocarpus sp. CCAP 1310/34]
MVAGGKEVGTGGGSVGGLGVHGLEWGLPQKEQDGGCFSLGVTGGSIDQQCRKDVCAPKYGCDSFNLTTSVESGFLFDTVSGVLRGEVLALVVEGGKEVGTDGGSVGGLGEHGLEWGLPQKEHDGGCFSLGVTGGNIDQRCRTDFCAPKYACDSFNLTTSVESGFLFDTVSGVLRGEVLALVVEGGKEVGTDGGSVGGLGEHGLEWGLPQKEHDGGCFSLGVTGGNIDQRCRTDFCAPKYACDSFNLTTSVESGFLFNTVSGVPGKTGPSFV